ncbi:50S ribosomal protein L2, partial [bacterium]|nr:50S ribosomal protein L2 [bacterium]
MPIKKFKPYTPTRRFQTVSTYSELTISNKPQRSLTKRIKSSTGHNNQGRITSRFRGGGSKKLYRQIDFKREKLGVPAIVKQIEYDPNRSANIALLNYKDGEKRYMIAPQTLTVGETLISGENSEIKIGNALPIKNIPVGSLIHNIELKP